MSKMKTLDLINTPLSGTNLIEASAGTGKTYTIAGLFLRLVLEKQFPADQILVVTFTRAGTEELKDRIRNKLLEAKEAFSKGSSDDLLTNTLIIKHANPALAIQLIQDALIDFDKAAIFTIHGFCQRILHENAFETGSLFDTELIADQVNMLQEISDDFWRKHFYTLPPELISYCLKKISGPEYFFKLLAKANTPDIKVMPEIQKPALPSLADFRKVFKKLQSVWPAARQRFESAGGGLKDPALSGTIYGSVKADSQQPGFTKRDLKVFSLVEAMNRLVDEKNPGFPLFQDFEKFTATKLKKSVKKGHIPPRHEIFDICDKLYQLSGILEAEMKQYLLFLKIELFKFARSELSIRKKKGNIQFFDDLLTMLKQALAGNSGNQLEDQSENILATVIRNKYKAALVDEFQDTDPIQHAIFSRLFNTQDSVLFMIGDPKQAIYSFRGADIFSYLQAARQADSRYTLTENWRSEDGLITAVNTIFSSVKKPFIFDEIIFEKGVGGGTGAKPTIATPALAPLKLWYLNSDIFSKKGKPINKKVAVDLIADAVANEIGRLIAPDKDGVRAGDIAVLVRTNRQAQIIKNRLAERMIPSVLYSSGNIFDSHEALELEIVLSSISEPGNEQWFKAALVTDMMGVKGNELEFEYEEPLWWETRLARFRDYFLVWKRYGFVRMFRQFMAGEGIRSRLLSFQDGDRRLTNILHLSEILHQQSIKNNKGMTGLLKWLSEQRDPVSPRLEEHQLRLESDEHSVKIVTIHKSKGLEYPVVFCPFGWESSLAKDKEILFHDNEENGRLTLDLGSSQQSDHLASAENELLAENLRLLYVVLTRAKSLCYLVWGRINTAETSAMAYLFHRKDSPSPKNDGIVASLKETFSEKRDDDLITDLKELVSRSEGTIELAGTPFENYSEHVFLEDKKEKLICRRFSGKTDKSWKVSSYSSLLSKRIRDDELPDRDAYPDITSIPPDYIEPPGKKDIFSFPPGTEAGIFFHDVFEHLDFASKDPDHQENLVESKLKEHGFDIDWKDSVGRTINKVLATPLQEKKNNFILSSIQLTDRINEMEFYFPLNLVTPSTLKRIFSEHSGINIPSGFPERLEKLTFSPVRGFMKGYIDMIFKYAGCYYLVDWKSNLLGARIEDYGQNILNETMQDDFYILQYHLYTLAFHQYLRMRFQDYRYTRDFGGVLYLFIRGMDPKSGPKYGIYFDLPSPNLISELGKALMPGF
ncbi:MAG: exodeoxyribonuclease V subunit beta [Deltaproteobacteria bacterium CG1_02_45_11]|nr:MAG: exodeoxyribonuclease V subunit beta [Deltaproteobacteria bacterium CG1_02_45_11]